MSKEFYGFDDPDFAVTKEMNMKTLEIPEDVIDEVVSALECAIGIAMVSAPTMVASLSETAVKLDEAINDALATEA